MRREKRYYISNERKLAKRIREALEVFRENKAANEDIEDYIAEHLSEYKKEILKGKQNDEG